MGKHYRQKYPKMKNFWSKKLKTWFSVSTKGLFRIAANEVKLLYTSVGTIRERRDQALEFIYNCKLMICINLINA